MGCSSFGHSSVQVTELGAYVPAEWDKFKERLDEDAKIGRQFAAYVEGKTLADPQTYNFLSTMLTDYRGNARKIPEVVDDQTLFSLVYEGMSTTRSLQVMLELYDQGVLTLDETEQSYDRATQQVGEFIVEELITQ